MQTQINCLCLRYWPNTDIGAVFQEEFYYKDEDGNKIEEKSDLKDLGIQMSADLTFTKQIDKVTTSCRTLCGWVMRTFRTRNPKVMVTIWNSLLQSKLDDCLMIR